MHSTHAIPTSTPTRASGSERDLVLDLVRAGALAVVVLWHWVFSTVAFPDGPEVGNPVGTTPGLWLLTWVLQPMPLFFAVGGCLHARTYDGRPVEFWRRRLRRLVVPTLPLVVPALLALAAANAYGRPDVARTIVLLLSPLWFLAVYLVLVLVAPLAITAHRCAPVVALTVLAASAVAVEVARFGLGWSGPAMVVASFLAMWALVHQLGFLLDDLRAAPVVTKVATAVGGIAGLAVLVTFGPYPAAMVGVPGEPVSNMGPPTLAPVWLGVLQLGVLALASAVLQRVAERHQSTLASVTRWTMPVYVWHLLGWAIFYAFVRLVGFEVLSRPTTQWWIQRPVWLVGPLIATIPLCRLVTRSRTNALPTRRAD